VPEYLLSLEPHIIFFYGIHIIISFVLAIILSTITTERFKRKSEEINRRDFCRLDEISERSFLYKKLFNVSLHKNNRITNILFLFLFNLAMPIIGYIFSIWVAIYLKNVSYQKKVVNTNILNLDEFGMTFLKVERIFGEGSMVELMNSQYAPRSKKLKALSSLSASLSPANLRIIRSTLSSRDDEIRMFGYSTINKAEKAINIKINKHLEIYNEESQKESALQDESRLALAAKELATLYWELVYTELSHESLKEGFLKEVKKYITIAKKYYIPKRSKIEDEIDDLEKELKTLEKNKNLDEMKLLEIELKNSKDKRLKIVDTITRLYVLMGKVYMNEKDYENASTELTIAQELHEDKSSFILPYLAEIQYLLGNYKAVNSIINRSHDLRLNATLHPIIEQWKSS
jgi:hypothetical protein